MVYWLQKVQELPQPLRAWLTKSYLTEPINNVSVLFVESENFNILKNKDSELQDLENLLKVIPFTENEIMYYAMVTIKPTGVFDIRVIEPFKYQRDNNYTCLLKRSIFPEYRGTKSIKHFKKLMEDGDFEAVYKEMETTNHIKDILKRIQ